MKIKFNYAFFYFLLFSISIILVYFYYQPSWGVMDDWQHLQTANGIWNSPNKLLSAFEYIKADFLSQKFRPIHCVYFFLVYRIFSEHPFIIYILIFIAQMIMLPLWGLIFHKIFYKKDETVASDTLFIFPLSFFFFTPFWNNFMYISLQEKFIFFFSALSIYFFVLSYERNKYFYLVVSLIINLFCLFSKPTGIYLIFSFMLFSILDLILMRKNKIASFVSVIFGIITLTGYYLLIKTIVTPGGYSFKYIKNFSILGIINQLSHAPLVIRALFVFSILYLFTVIILSRRKSINFNAVLLPLSFISYILVLAPWGIMNYFLAPAAPFILGMFFPIYRSLVRLLRKLKLACFPPAFIIFLSFIVLSQLIIPRISKIADIKKTIAKITEIKEKDHNAKFYFPPPYMETHFALSNFSKTDIAYLHQGTLRSDLLGEKNNYLIYRDECAMIELIDVRLQDVVYQNNTWKIFKVVRSEGERKTMFIEFPKTFLIKIITYLRDKV